MSKSIMQTKKECYLCRKQADQIGYRGELSPYGLDEHHVVFGTGNRKLSEKHGLKVWLCHDVHHEFGPQSAHMNAEVKAELIRDAQRKFESLHGHSEWMKIFGRNWLEVEEWT